MAQGSESERRESSPLEKYLASSLAKTIRDRRKALGLSQEDVALRAGINRNHYQVMESARSDRHANKALNPRLFTVLRVAHALGLPAEELLAGLSRDYERALERGYEL